MRARLASFRNDVMLAKLRLIANDPRSEREGA